MNYMPWCPSCKTEYIEGITKCADCDSKLVQVLEPEILKDSLKEWDNQNREVFLVSTSGTMEYNIIKSLLESEGIHTLRKMAGTGQYINVIFGSTFTGIDIYVLSNEFDKAKEILEATVIEESGADVRESEASKFKTSGSDEYENNDDLTNDGLDNFRIKSKFKKIAWIIIIVFIIIYAISKLLPLA